MSASPFVIPAALLCFRDNWCLSSCCLHRLCILVVCLVSSHAEHIEPGGSGAQSCNFSHWESGLRKEPKTSKCLEQRRVFLSCNTKPLFIIYNCIALKCAVSLFLFVLKLRSWGCPEFHQEYHKSWNTLCFTRELTCLLHWMVVCFLWD